MVINANLSFLVLYYFFGKGTQLELFFIPTAGLAAVIYPKKESLIMYLMIILSFALFFAATLYGPDYAGRVETAEVLSLGNALSYPILFTMVLVLTLVARYSTIGAEDRLLESRKKIAGLTDKLKIYLPRQFVDSLAMGDRAAEPDYKRRRLTIFFSDVRGFTAWTDKLEPEDTREILNQYLSEMSAIADKWGGTIDKFIGDAIMIFFGDPEFTNDRDHALRCVKMALEMQIKMNELRAEWEDRGHLEPLHIRIGINTGYATVGNFGSKDRLNYTILGSAVNLASRLETTSNPDKITISHMTWSLIKSEITCEPKSEITIKGFSEPVKIYEVVGINPSPNSVSA
jgi:class 3 adenylate cyclase